MASLEVETRSPETKALLDQFTASEHLTPTQKELLFQLLEKNLDVFNYKPDQLGKTHLTEHTIDTGNNPPVCQRPYRISPRERELMAEQVQEMLDQQIITESNSPWASPVVLVVQKDKVRFCVDYRKLNAATKRDTYPLPRIDDTLERLTGSSFFSSMDCDRAFHQVGVKKEDREKTAFITPFGLYEYLRMPFGMTNSPSTYQRLMDTVLGKLRWSIALVYLDDIVVFSKTFEAHLANLDLVFQALRKSGLTLKPSKCHFTKQNQST